MDKTLELLPYISSAVIILAFFWALAYIRRVPSDQLKHKQNWLEQLPSLISTLGVIGTFLGITVGLIAFNSHDLDKSIPLFLDGLRTAFFTSLLGMIGSLILNRTLSKKLSDETESWGIEKATQSIIEALNTNHNTLIKAMNSAGYKTSADNVSEIKTMIKGIASDLSQMKDDIEQLKDIISPISEIENATKDISQTIQSIYESSSIEACIDQTRAVLMTATASIATIDNNLDEIMKKVKSDESQA